MRILIRSILFFILVGVQFPGGIAIAGPARPKLLTLQQPDGALFEARRWGNEEVHGWETADGYTIVKSETGRWCYAVNDSTGALVPTVGVAGADVPPAEAFHARPLPGGKPDRLLMRQRTASLRYTLGLFSTETALAVTEGKIPVILANFNDTQTKFTNPDFFNLLFGTGTKSMADYYSEASYGAFTLSGEVYGWVQVPGDHDWYGKNDGSGYDDKPGKFVFDAVTLADEDVDFSLYDLDGDCDVDVVAVIHQGEGEDGGGTDADIWSQRWTLRSSDAGAAFTTNDTCKADPGRKVIVNDFIIIPEKLDGRISTMGVFAHEYGHALGLPDLYDTDLSKSEGIGRWSLMASGSWNRVVYDGDSPAHLDPWCKYKLGWVSPTPVAGSSNDCSIVAAATQNPDPAKLVYRLGDGSAVSGEYFLVENRHKAGFDSGLPGQGLLIWHVDAPVRTNDRECWPGGKYPCTADRHYKVALMQADNSWDLEKGLNRGDPGDPFPGIFGTKTYFGWASQPSSRLYSGKSSGAAVRNISLPSLTMTATLDMEEACDYVVTPSSISFGPGGGEGLLKVLTPKGCPAPAVSTGTGWIIDPAGSSASVRFHVEANGTGAEKSGVITVGDKKVAVTVAGNNGPLKPEVSSVVTPTVLKSQMLYGTVRRGSMVSVVADTGTFSATVDGTDWSVLIPLREGENTFFVRASDETSQEETPPSSIVVEQPQPGYFGMVAQNAPGGTVTQEGLISVPNGGNVTYTIKAASGYSLLNVMTSRTEGIYASVGKKSRYTFKNVSDNRGILANFKRKTYRISAKAGTGGIVSAVESKVKFHDDAAVTFTPLPGFFLARVLIDGVTVCGDIASCTAEDASHVFEAVDRHHSIKAYFGRE